LDLDFRRSRDADLRRPLLRGGDWPLYGCESDLENSDFASCLDSGFESVLESLESVFESLESSLGSCLLDSGLEASGLDSGLESDLESFFVSDF